MAQPVGGVSLALRGVALAGLPWLHGAGVGVGATLLIGVGGVFPVLKDWMDDRIHDRMDVVTRLGGLRVRLPGSDRDVDFGPILARAEAPRFHDLVESTARRLGAAPPDEIRLAFLPCCGVVSDRRSRVLLVGLPLLHVLSRGDLQAVLAHEMAHLAGGDATRVMDGVRFVEGLRRALDDPGGTSWGPLRLWSRACLGLGRAIANPVARGQEARADRASANIAGGGVAATALARVAMVQPLFREVLARSAGERPDRPNVFATFRAFWDRLPPGLIDEMRLRLQSERVAPDDDPHPPLADRLAALSGFADRPEVDGDGHPASGLLSDPEWLEEMLDEALFRRGEARPNVFHRAGS